MRGIKEGDGTQTRLWGACVVLGQLWSVLVETSELERFDPDSEKKIAESFPSIAGSPDAREFLISGISPLGWRQVFGKDASDG